MVEMWAAAMATGDGHEKRRKKNRMEIKMEDENGSESKSNRVPNKIGKNNFPSSSWHVLTQLRSHLYSLHQLHIET